MTAVVFFFAFSSVLSNYVCAEANLFFLGGRRQAINSLKIVTLTAIVFGAMSKLTLVWALADLAMALMAIANLVAICLLGKWAFAAIRDYHRQSAEGKHPVSLPMRRTCRVFSTGTSGKPPSAARSVRYPSRCGCAGRACDPRRSLGCRQPDGCRPWGVHVTPGSTLPRRHRVPRRVAARVDGRRPA
jgi:hypothetical protein